MPGSRWRRAAAGHFAGLLAAVLAAAATLPASAQDDGGQQALVRAQSLLRQASARNQELEAANARLAAELEMLKKQLGSTAARLEETGNRLALEQRQRQRAEASGERLAGTEGALRDRTTELRQTLAQLRETEQARAGLAARLAETVSALRDSEDKNLRLYQANLELLELYRRKGPLAALLQREPVTGLKDVEIQNVLQEYRLKLDAARVEPGSAEIGPADIVSSP